MVGTLQCISSDTLARRDADASPETGRAVNANEAFDSAPQQTQRDRQVRRTIDTRDAVPAEIEQVFAFGVSKMRTDRFSTGTRRQTLAPCAASRTSAGGQRSELPRAARWLRHGTVDQTCGVDRY
jgi:hypothetical protein